MDDCRLCVAIEREDATMILRVHAVMHLVALKDGVSGGEAMTAEPTLPTRRSSAGLGGAQPHEMPRISIGLADSR